MTIAFTMPDLSAQQRDNRAALLATLELSTMAHRREIIESACLSTGGTLIPKAPGSWGPFETQITLLGIHATGTTFDAAIAQWRKCAMRVERAAQEQQV